MRRGWFIVGPLSVVLGVAACLEGLTGGPGDAGPDVVTDSGGCPFCPHDGGPDTALDSAMDSGPDQLEAEPGCQPPEGGLPCAPGFVDCNPPTRCSVPANFCCLTADASPVCETTGAMTCPGIVGQ